MTVIYIAALLAALAAGLAVWSVWGSLDPHRRQVVANLSRPVAGPATTGEEEVEGLRAHQSPLEKLAHRLTPDLIVRVLDRQHSRAGRPAAWPLERLLLLKMVWVPLAIVLNASILLSEPAPLLALTTFVASVAVYFLPELLLSSRGQERNEAIQLALADTLDQMTIAVEAGLGFDSAMARAAHNGTGPLAEELARTLQDIQMGRSRRQAFEALADRTAAADLRRFLRAVIQADAYGISIADVLRTQADDMRIKRRQRAEEKAQKLPVKVLAPLMLCILPVLFIVVMGPAVINIVAAFSGM